VMTIDLRKICDLSKSFLVFHFIATNNGYSLDNIKLSKVDNCNAKLLRSHLANYSLQKSVILKIMQKSRL
jgi:hypothetical protein